MKNQTKFTIIGWAGFLIMLVLFLQKCGCENCPGVLVQTETKTELVHDTTIKETLKPYGVPMPPDSFIVQIPACVDTALILQTYFNKYYYSNTYADSNEVLTINDTVSQNKIIGRGLKYQWLKPLVVNTTINTPIQVAKPKRDLFMGVFAAANISGSNAGFGAQILFKTKKQTMYDARYDFLQKRIEFGASFKLKFGNATN